VAPAATTAQPAPGLTDVNIIGVRSAVHPEWEAISDGQLRTADHHGGAWLEIKTEDVGQGRDRYCRVNQEQGRQIDEDRIVGSGGIIVGYKHSWRFEPFIEGRGSYEARSSVGPGHHTATLQIARNSPPPPPPTPAPEKTKLRVTLFPWIPDAGRDYFEGYLRRIKNEFEVAHPTVELILHPMDATKDLYKAGVVKGLMSDSDLIEVDMVILDSLVAADCIEPWSQPPSPHLHPAAMAACQYNSTAYAVPHWLCGHFVVTRDESIAAATTAQQFVAALDGIQAGKVDLVADFTGGWNLPALYLDAWADSHGADGLPDAVTGAFDQVTANLVETIADQGDWNTRNPCLNGAFNGNDRAATLFAAGVADALIGYSERLHVVSQFDSVGKQLFISSAPLGAGSHPVLFVDGFVLRKGVDAPVKDAAALFATYMNDPTTMEWMLLSKDAPGDSSPRYLLPADLRVYERPAFKADPFYLRFHELTRNGKPFPSAGLSDHRKRIGKSMEETFED